MIEMVKETGQKFIHFCVKNACFILPYPNIQTRAAFIRNSALFFYVLVLLFFQINLYRLSPQILGFANNIAVDDLYKMVNQERAKQNLPALKRNTKLEKAALLKAKDMFAKDYWAHYAPDGSTTPWQLMLKAGYVYKYAGENLAKDFNTSESVMVAWMASPSHRANIVNSNYKDIGMVAVDGNLLGEETTLIVQMFGSQSGSSGTFASTGKGTVGKPSGNTAGAEVKPAAPAAQPVAVVGPAEVGVQPKSVALAQTGLTPVQQIVKALNPTASPKTVPMGFGFFLMGLFALDEAYTLRGGLTREELKRTAENVGHMAILGLLIAVVWFARVGGVA